MEETPPHDLYFSWPDLIADSYPEEIYLSWRDLVGKSDPEEIYFSWEDIMGDRYSKQDSHPQTTLSTNLVSFKGDSYKSSAQSDAGDSRWDDTESNLSFEVSSAAGSCSTITSKCAHDKRDNYTEAGRSPPCSILPPDRFSAGVPSTTYFPSRRRFSLGMRETPKCRPQHEKSFFHENNIEEMLEARVEYGLWRAYHHQNR